MEKFKGTPGPWSINHWSKNPSNGVVCISQGSINEFMGDAVVGRFYGIRSKLDPMTYTIAGSFEGAHITDIDDFQYIDGGVESKANAQLIAAAPELLAFAMDFISKVESGHARSTDSYGKAKLAVSKALGI